MIKGSKFRAAIGSKSLIQIEGLKELAFPINDVPGNCTRFVLLSKESNSNLGNIASFAFSLLSNISEVLSHPQALAQCSEWLSENLPNAIALPTNSTSEAVNMVKGSKFRAAIGSKSLIEIEGLKELAFPINDVPGLSLIHI